MHRLLWQTVLLGLAVAVIVVVRLRVLEHRSEEAERQMRELSQQLVNTQEEERRNLSRELHDHVAQVLTGLRMGLGRIERTSGDPRVVHRGRRVPEARRRHVPHRARSRARPAPEHARRLRAAGRRSNGTCATSRGATRRRRAQDGRRLRRAAGQASHLRLPRRSGGDDQLRAARAGHDDPVDVQRHERPVAGVGDRRWRRPRSGHAAGAVSACAASTSG